MSGFIDKIRFCVLPLIHQNSNNNLNRFKMTTATAPAAYNVQLHISLAADNKEFFIMSVKAAVHFKKRGNVASFNEHLQNARKYFNSYC